MQTTSIGIHPLPDNRSVRAFSTSTGQLRESLAAAWRDMRAHNARRLGVPPREIDTDLRDIEAALEGVVALQGRQFDADAALSAADRLLQRCAHTKIRRPWAIARELVKALGAVAAAPDDAQSVLRARHLVHDLRREFLDLSNPAGEPTLVPPARRRPGDARPR
jgi:hypothetical protein